MREILSAILIGMLLAGTLQGCSLTPAEQDTIRRAWEDRAAERARRGARHSPEGEGHPLAGHPVSVEPVTPEEVHASLLIFPELAALAGQLAYLDRDARHVGVRERSGSKAPLPGSNR